MVVTVIHTADVSGVVVDVHDDMLVVVVCSRYCCICCSDYVSS